MKHRITGAGVLIFFGALVLPWLLGPPSEAKKEDVSEAIIERHSTFEDQVLAELKGDDKSFQEPDETVYVSRITPVAGGKERAASEPQKSTPSGVASSGSSDDTNTRKKTPPLASGDDSAAEKTTEASVSKKSDSTKATAPKQKKNVAIKKTISKPKSTPPPVKKKKAVVKKVAPAKVDVGWVVQVELLVDKKGAKRLVDELNGKGFAPRTTVVDTNRGKKTGTRIWLGPFEQRAQAGAENNKLKEKMGKSGFIRVYP